MCLRNWLRYVNDPRSYRATRAAVSTQVLQYIVEYFTTRNFLFPVTISTSGHLQSFSFFCEAADRHFCCSLSLAGCRLAGCSQHVGYTATCS